jgi:hypothetical protein
MLLLGAAACGGTPGPEATATPDGDGTLATATATATATDPPPGERMPASWRPCDKPSAGYSIGYPNDWFTAAGTEWECSLFHPSSFTVPVAGEFPLVALNAVQTPDTVSAYRAGATDPAFYTVVRNEDVTILDRPGVRFETVGLGDGLDDPGLRRYGYIIDSGGGRAFVVFTVAAADETRYDDWKLIVDIARSSVRFLH